MPIATRAEFDAVLERTLGDVARRAKAEPHAREVWNALGRQLLAMREWAKAGVPTPEQRERVWPGLLAQRELEPVPEGGPDLADLVQRLHDLQLWFQTWPDAAS